MVVKIKEELTILLGKCKTSLKELEEEVPPEVAPEEIKALAEKGKIIPIPTISPAIIPEEEEETINIVKDLKTILAQTNSAIKRTNNTLSGISSAIQAQARYSYESKEVGLKALDCLNKIKESAEADRKERTETFEFVYPIGGGVQAIPAGTTVINIENGEVFLADNTQDKLDNSLNWVGQEWARSLFIDAKKPFTVKLDDKIEHTVGPDDFFLRVGTRCKTVSIEVTESTSIKFWASTSPYATLAEARNMEISGIDRWNYTSFDVTPISPGYGVEIDLKDIPVNLRVKVERISITCPKSCIQPIYICVRRQNLNDFWRLHLYDREGTFIYNNLTLIEGEELLMRYFNRTGEDIKFNIEVLGVEETV